MNRLIVNWLIRITLIVLLGGSVSAQSGSVAGEWDASMNTPGGTRPFRLIFKVEGEKLTGTVKRTNGDVPLQGTFKGSDIRFDYTITYNGNALQLIFEGKVVGDAMSGSVSFGGNGDDQWSAKRIPPEKPKR